MTLTCMWQCTPCGRSFSVKLANTSMWQCAPCGRSFSVKLANTSMWQCAPCGRSFSVNLPLPVSYSVHHVRDYSVLTDPYLYVTVHTPWEIIECEVTLTCMWQFAPYRRSSPHESPDRRKCWSKTRHVYPRQIPGISCSGVIVHLH